MFELIIAFTSDVTGLSHTAAQIGIILGGGSALLAAVSGKLGSMI